jgi:hypothetical protein
MLITCRILRGQLQSEQTLEEFAPFAHSFYQHRPKMVKYRKDGITLLIFTNLKFRLMGGGCSHIVVLEEFLRNLPWKVDFGSLRLSTMTATHQLDGFVNLHKLNRKKFMVEQEIFPAAKWLHGGREHFNIFHTGRVVITGIKDINKVEYDLLPQLSLDVQHALHH